ncbi:MAG: PepSY domain-containing protein [Aquabacterium sp.]
MPLLHDASQGPITPRLALPILIVGLTAVFIAHKKSLGTDDIKVSAQWLPGYAIEKADGTAGHGKMPEVRASLTTRSGQTLVGTQDGLYQLRGDKFVPVQALDGVPVRGLTESAFGLVAAAKNGIWVNTGGDWQRAMKGDAWNASTRADGTVVVAMKDDGLLLSRDGRTWEPDAALVTALAALPMQAEEKPMTLGKLVMDLHTGKAFLGKSAEWIWIDLVGLAMSLLALTGVYMWWRGEKRKAAAAAAALQTQPVGATTSAAATTTATA